MQKKKAGEQVKEEYVIDINHTDEYEDLEISTVTEHTRAHLKIQDGCNNFLFILHNSICKGKNKKQNNGKHKS